MTLALMIATDEAKRNYFGTLMLVFVPLALLLPGAIAFFRVEFSHFEKLMRAGDYWESMTILLYSNIFRVWAVLALILALVRRKWFDGSTEHYFKFLPLVFIATDSFFHAYGSFAAEVKKALLERTLAPLRNILPFFFRSVAYYMAFKSLHASGPTPLAFLFQPFFKDRKGFQINPRGCCLTALTIILPNIFVLLELAKIDFEEDKMLNYNVILFLLTVACSIEAVYAFEVISVYPDRASQNRPFFSGISALAAPVLFLHLYHQLGKLSSLIISAEIWKKELAWISAMQGMGTFGVFCTAYLMAGVVGYVAYVMPLESSLSRIYRTFTCEITKEPALAKVFEETEAAGIDEVEEN